MATTRSRRSPQGYLSPQHSPSPALVYPESQGDWEQRSQELQRSRSISSSSGLEASLYPHYHRVISLPSPPQQHSAFAHTTFEYTRRTIHDSPLTPPASDGIMSPPTNDQEFGDKALDPSMSNMWMNYGTIKAEDGNMPIPGHVVRSPPTQFIEDIFREDGHRIQSTGSGYLDENSFDFPPPSPLKRKRDEYMSTPYQGLHSSEGLASPSKRRTKRHLTDPSEAQFHCEKCGKGFSRIWNFNSHQDTHNPDRPRPHVCQHRSCGKAFVRRTDLARHMQCVHTEDKKYKCDLCENKFARKDTLRRHRDDGCPNRADFLSRNSKCVPLNVQSRRTLNYLFLKRESEQLYPGQFGAQPRNQSFDPALTSGVQPMPDMVSIQKAVWGP